MAKYACGVNKGRRGNICARESLHVRGRMTVCPTSLSQEGRACMHDRARGHGVGGSMLACDHGLVTNTRAQAQSVHACAGHHVPALSWLLRRREHDASSSHTRGQVNCAHRDSSTHCMPCGSPTRARGALQIHEDFSCDSSFRRGCSEQTSYKHCKTRNKPKKVFRLRYEQQQLEPKPCKLNNQT